MSAGPHATPVFTELHVRRLGPVRRFFVRRPRALDIAVVLCFAAWALLVGVGADSMYVLSAYLGGERVLLMQSVSVLLTLSGSAVLLWRRDRPVLVTAGMTVLGAVAFATTGAASGFELGLAVALYAVAAYRPPVVAWTSGALAVAVLLLLARLLPLPQVVGTIMLGATPENAAALQAAVWYQSAVPIVVLALLAVAFGTSARNKRMHIARFVDAANAVARDHESRTRLAQAAERARIAREMHDVVAHSITVMVALGGGASASMVKAPGRSRLALDELVATGRSALEDMRRVLGVLDEEPRLDTAAAQTGQTAPPTAPTPGSPEIPDLLDRFRLAGLRIRATGEIGILGDNDAGLQLAVYRILQESLTNVLRHAPGTPVVEVDVRPHLECLEVVVTDHGATTRFESDDSSGRGVLGMRERASVFGGTVEAGPYADGWRVRAQLPWSNVARALPNGETR